MLALTACRKGDIIPTVLKSAPHVLPPDEGTTSEAFLLTALYGGPRPQPSGLGALPARTGESRLQPCWSWERCPVPTLWGPVGCSRRPRSAHAGRAEASGAGCGRAAARTYREVRPHLPTQISPGPSGYKEIPPIPQADGLTDTLSCIHPSLIHPRHRSGWGEHLSLPPHGGCHRPHRVLPHTASRPPAHLSFS